MTGEKKHEIVVIGGSAGSFPVILEILRKLPKEICVPVVLVIHRLKNVPSEMDAIFSVKKRIIEPEDKEKIDSCSIYLAPQNYHLLVEEDRSFSLDYSELVHYSRPSIDVSFSSIARAYGPGAVAVLLSGANKDGTEGMSEILLRGGSGIIQDPATAEFRVMPMSAMLQNPGAAVMAPQRLTETILKLVA